MLEEIMAWQPPSAGSRPVPIGSRSHRSESPTGYSSAGCSPVEPASASPLTDHRSSIPMRVWLRSSVALVVSTHNGVSSLLWAQGDISSVTGPLWSTALSHDPVAGVLLLSGVGAWPPPDGVG
jgi:hypothetical protein